MSLHKYHGDFQKPSVTALHSKSQNPFKLRFKRSFALQVDTQPTGFPLGKGSKTPGTETFR